MILTAFEEPKVRTSVGANTDGRKGCVCVLDDDSSMLKAVERLLKSEEIAVQTFSDPAKFLSAIKDADCPVAILDVWMPEMNGLEVQARMRKESPQTHVIFVSAHDDPSIRQSALEAGAFAFLPKPFDDELLLEALRKAIDS